MITMIKTAFLVAFLLLVSAPATADTVLHIWSCQLNEGKTRADILEVSKAWTDAAKTIDGGADIDVSLEFPYAANVPDGSFNFILSIPSTRTWGIWEENYPGSAAAEIDAAWSEVATCSNSSLWSSVPIV